MKLSLQTYIALGQGLSLIALLGIHEGLIRIRRPIEVRRAQAVRRLAPVLSLALSSSTRQADLTEAIALNTGRGVEVIDPQGKISSRAGPTTCADWEAHVLADGTKLRFCSAGLPGRGEVHRVLVLGASAIAAWLIALLLARRISRPLRQLQRTAESMRDGAWTIDVPPPHGPVELQSLSASVQALGHRLSKKLLTQRDLLALASHELRTPLARLQIQLGLAREGIQQADQFDLMEREMEEMAELVDDVLATSRIESQPIAATLMLVSDTVCRFDDVDVSGDSEIWADPVLFERLLSIIIDNARRHGAPPIRVIVTSALKRVIVRIEDSGPGFDRTNSGAGGAGIGLSLARRIAQLHGALFLTSTEATGAVVTLDWPAAQPTPRDALRD